MASEKTDKQWKLLRFKGPQAVSEQGRKSAINLDSIDIDQLEVEVLIVCRNPASFQQSGAFLSRRGWPTTVVGTLTRAVELIVKNHPDIILISMNHPNPGVLKLPAIIGAEKASPTVCIGFAEGNDVSTLARLQTATFHHKMQGMPSGPNIERIVRRIVADRVEAEKKRMPPIDPAAAEDAKIVVAGSSTPVAPDALVDMGTYRVGRKKERVRLKDIAAPAGEDVTKIKSSMKKELMELSRGNNVRGESGMMLLPTKAEAEVETGVVTQKGIKGRPDFVSQQLEQMKKGNFSQVQSGNKGQKFSLVSQGPKSTLFTMTETGPPSVPIHRAGGDASVQPMKVDKEALASLGPADAFDRSIEEALRRTTTPSETVEEGLVESDRLMLISVESSGTRGIFVLCGTSHSEEYLRSFAIEYKVKLQRLFLESGMKAVIKEPVNIHCAPFLYADWALKEASVSYLVNHKGRELGVAFVVTGERLPVANKTKDKEMMQIAVKDIDLEKPIPFKAYIYFPKSEKYFLYVRDGRHLSEEQQRRLLENKTADFFIKSKDVQHYDLYVASLFILNSVARYRKTQAVA